MQYPVIYAIFSHLNRCNSFSHYHVSLASKTKKEKSQKIDDLPVLATCWSVTLAILSSQVNGSVAHESTRQCLILFMEAVD